MSLDDYVKNMTKDQKEIYYFANTDKEHIKNSPQLEAFVDKKIPVLFMTDAVDEFWLQNIRKYKELEFKSISKGKVDISKLGIKQKDKKETSKKINNKINDLTSLLKKELKDKISDVIISDRLMESVKKESTFLFHGFTYSGHPACCAAAIKNIEILKRDKILENVKSLSKYFMNQLETLYDLPIVGDVRGKGLMAGIECVIDKKSKKEFLKKNG